MPVVIPAPSALFFFLSESSPPSLQHSDFFSSTLNLRDQAGKLTKYTQRYLLEIASVPTSPLGSVHSPPSLDPPL